MKGNSFAINPELFIFCKMHNKNATNTLRKEDRRWKTDTSAWNGSGWIDSFASDAILDRLSK